MKIALSLLSLVAALTFAPEAAAQARKPAPPVTRPKPAPEPLTLLGLAAGAGGLLAYRMRKRNSK